MDGPTFTAPLPAPEPAAVDAFLSAADSAMNGNPLLLTATCDVPVTVGNRQDVLHAFLRSPLFEPLVRDADRRRGWYNLADYGDDRPWERPLLRAGLRAASTTTSAARCARGLLPPVTTKASTRGQDGTRHPRPAAAPRTSAAQVP